MNAEIIQFLTELRQNNNREWFQANKSRYDSLRKGFIACSAFTGIFVFHRTRLRIRFILQPIWLPVGDGAASVPAIIFILNRVAACFREVFGVRRLPC